MELTTKKYEIIDLIEVPLDDISPNPLNPRPAFHLSDDDPELLSMAASIATEGLHRPAMIYELVGHYEQKDAPRKFVLLQGERRWRASKLAKVGSLKANLHRVPQDKAEELELLGIEDAHKMPWQQFFEMRHAKALADTYGVSVAHADIVNKTGLSMDQLRTAEKIFSLEPEIQALCAAYEEEVYSQRVSGKRKGSKAGRVRLSGTGVSEFTTTKAALTWDIFCALREHLTIMVKDYDDVELQKRIATWACNGASTDDLSGFNQAIRQAGEHAPTKMLTRVHNLLKNPESSVKASVNALGMSQVQKLNIFLNKLEQLTKDAVTLTRKADQLGHNPGKLNETRLAIVSTVRELERMERAVSDRIAEL